MNTARPDTSKQPSTLNLTLLNERGVMSEIRYRVVGKDYVVFDGGIKVKKGNLIPKDIHVEDWLVDVGWVEENI